MEWSWGDHLLALRSSNEFRLIGSSPIKQSIHVTEIREFSERLGFNKLGNILFLVFLDEQMKNRRIENRTIDGFGPKNVRQSPLQGHPKTEHKN